MIAAGNDVQIRQQRGIIQGRGHLSHAAAHGIVPAGVFGGGLVALGRAELAHNIAEGKGLAGFQYSVVQLVAGQLQVGIAVAVAGGTGLMFTQGIPEEGIGVQNVRLDVLHGDTDLVAVVGFVNELLGGFQVEAVTVRAGDGLKGLQIHGGVHRLDVEFLVNGFQIHRVRFRGGFHILHFHQEHMQAVSIQNLIVDIVHVETDAGGAHGDDQRLAGSVLVELVCGQLRLGAFQAIGGLGQGAAGILGIGGQSVLDIIGIQIQIGEQGDDVLLGLGSGVNLIPLRLGAGAAVFIGGVDGGLHVQLCIGVLGRQAKLGAGQIDDHILTAIGLVGGLLHGADGFILGHAAHVDISQEHIVQDPVVIGIGGAGHEDGDDHHDQHQCRAAQAQHDGLLVFVVKIQEHIELGRLGRL